MLACAGLPQLIGRTMRRTLVIAVVAAVAEQRHRCFTRPEDFDVGALNGRWSNRTGGGYDAAVTVWEIPDQLRKEPVAPGPPPPS